MKARLRIDTITDRDTMALALASSGRTVWIEEERGNFNVRYYVCFLLEEDEMEAEDEI